MAWFIPLLIFLARICDVSIGTVRTMLVIAGHSFIAAALGFVEVVIWVLAVGGALKHLTHPLAVVGYAGGFAVGVLVGMWIEEKIALGYRIVQVMAPANGLDVCERLRDRGFRVTRVDGRGRDGMVEIALLVIPRRQLNRVRLAVREIAPEAFVTVERVDRPLHAATGGRFGRSLLERIVVRK